MFKIACFVVLILASAFISSNAQAIEAGSEKNSTVDSPIVTERISVYSKSIRYWDTSNQEVRKSILKELAAAPALDNDEVKIPGCPRIRFPLICDNEGTVSENVCYFRMRRREKANLLPIMVFTTTLLEAARPMCENEIRKKP